MYRYYCPMRPPTIGTIPTFGLVEIVAYDERRYEELIDRMTWGWIAFNRPLEPSEIAEYELVSAPRIDVEGRIFP